MHYSKHVFGAKNAHDKILNDLKNCDEEEQRDDIKELHVDEEVAREPDRPQRHC